jgi:hypothetical protein
MKKLQKITFIITVVLLTCNSAFAQTPRKSNDHSKAQIEIQSDSIDTKDKIIDFITNIIVPFYAPADSSNFDALVEKTSLELLRRDRAIIGTAQYNDSVLIFKIENLENYHNAKLLLSQKYSKQEIENAIKILEKNIFQSVEVANLRVDLINYGYIQQDFDELLKSINDAIPKMQKDGLSPANIRVIISEKIFEFLYESDNGNGVSSSLYPYIFEECNRILKEKRDLQK